MPRLTAMLRRWSLVQAREAGLPSERWHALSPIRSFVIQRWSEENPTEAQAVTDALLQDFGTLAAVIALRSEEDGDIPRHALAVLEGVAEPAARGRRGGGASGRRGTRQPRNRCVRVSNEVLLRRPASGTRDPVDDTRRKDRDAGRKVRGRERVHRPGREPRAARRRASSFSRVGSDAGRRGGRRATRRGGISP